MQEIRSERLDYKIAMSKAGKPLSYILSLTSYFY